MCLKCHYWKKERLLSCPPAIFPCKSSVGRVISLFLLLHVEYFACVAQQRQENNFSHSTVFAQEKGLGKKAKALPSPAVGSIFWKSFPAAALWLQRTLVGFPGTNSLITVLFSLAFSCIAKRGSSLYLGKSQENNLSALSSVVQPESWEEVTQAFTLLDQDRPVVSSFHFFLSWSTL